MVVPAMPQQTKATLTDRAYDILRPLTTVWLPGLSTLYFTLAQILGLPAAEQVVGCIAALNVFLGLVLAQSRKNYNDVTNPAGKFDGQMVISQNPVTGGKIVNLVPNDDMQKIEQKEQVVYQVVVKEAA